MICREPDFLFFLFIHSRLYIILREENNKDSTIVFVLVNINIFRKKNLDGNINNLCYFKFILSFFFLQSKIVLRQKVNLTHLSLELNLKHLILKLK